MSTMLSSDKTKHNTLHMASRQTVKWELMLQNHEANAVNASKECNGSKIIIMIYGFMTLPAKMTRQLTASQ